MNIEGYHHKLEGVTGDLRQVRQVRQGFENTCLENPGMLLEPFFGFCLESFKNLASFASNYNFYSKAYLNWRLGFASSLPQNASRPWGGDGWIRMATEGARQIPMHLGEYLWRLKAFSSNRSKVPEELNFHIILQHTDKRVTCRVPEACSVEIRIIPDSEDCRALSK